VNSTSRRRIAKFIAAQLVAGESPKRIARVLAAYLSSNHQMRQSNLIIRDIETELVKNYQHLSVDITSARALTTETRDALVDMLKAATGAKTVELSERVDGDLLGGVIVRTPEAEMDASLKKKLTRLRAI
jgi:F-type H+-transporting ATPase subunit delta